VAAACGGDAVPGDRSSVRDSAGITIVESQAASWRSGDEWTIASEPGLTIGVLEGDPDYQLFDVGRALRLDDGRIVVANAGTHELRFYDASGAFLHSAGGQGDGPGEFQDIGWLAPLGGDTLATYDYGARRISLFDSEGTFLSTAAPQPPEGESNPLFVAYMSDGSLLAVSLIAVSPATESGLHRNAQLLVRYRPDGTFIDSVGRFPGRETYVKVDDGRVTASALPFERRAGYAASDQGIYVGGADRPVVGLFGTDGRLLRVIRWNQPLLEVTPKMIDEIKRQRSERWEELNLDAAFRAQMEAMQEEMPWPDRLPAYSRFIVDADQNLWVERFSTPMATTSRWSVFDPDGILLGEVETPYGVRIFQIGSDFMLGVGRDAMDVEQVRVYGLNKGSAAP
jgi:hypothetical protein